MRQRTPAINDGYICMALVALGIATLDIDNNKFHQAVDALMSNQENIDQSHVNALYMLDGLSTLLQETDNNLENTLRLMHPEALQNITHEDVKKALTLVEKTSTSLQQ